MRRPHTDSWPSIVKQSFDLIEGHGCLGYPVLVHEVQNPLNGLLKLGNVRRQGSRQVSTSGLATHLLAVQVGPYFAVRLFSRNRRASPNRPRAKYAKEVGSGTTVTSPD